MASALALVEYQVTPSLTLWSEFAYEPSTWKSPKRMELRQDMIINKRYT
ncbi:hypothetical protein AB6F62_18995 [Providencia huaxiensis]